MGGCVYCYAKRKNDRFKFIKDWTKPQFYENRLIEPSLIKRPSVIFVVSMGDLFGEGVEIEWIYRVIEVCKNNPRHTFMFLTKNPVGYNGFSFPDNCMLGLTMTTANNDNMQSFVDYSHGRRFLSIEPLLGSFSGFSFKGVELVIVGAMTGTKAVIPKMEWVNSIRFENIFYKKNLGVNKYQ